jgi:hypothetical protein
MTAPATVEMTLSRSQARDAVRWLLAYIADADRDAPQKRRAFELAGLLDRASHRRDGRFRLRIPRVLARWFGEKFVIVDRMLLFLHPVAQLCHEATSKRRGRPKLLPAEVEARTKPDRFIDERWARRLRARAKASKRPRRGTILTGFGPE